MREGAQVSKQLKVSKQRLTINKNTGTFFRRKMEIVLKKKSTTKKTHTHTHGLVRTVAAGVSPENVFVFDSHGCGGAF